MCVCIIFIRLRATDLHYYLWMWFESSRPPSLYSVASFHALYHMSVARWRRCFHTNAFPLLYNVFIVVVSAEYDDDLLNLQNSPLHIHKKKKVIYNGCIKDYLCLFSIKSCTYISFRRQKERVSSVIILRYKKKNKTSK